MGMERTCYCAIWLLMTFGTACIITAAATSYWRGDSDNHEGIFEKCNPRCQFIKFFHNNTGKELEAVRLLMLAGIAFLGIAMFLSIVSACVEKDLFFALVVLDTFAFLCCTAAMALYTYHYRNSDLKWKWSFIVGWTGCGVYGVGTFLLYAARCLNKDQ